MASKKTIRVHLLITIDVPLASPGRASSQPGNNCSFSTQNQLKEGYLNSSLSMVNGQVGRIRVTLDASIAWEGDFADERKYDSHLRDI
jgi:hypothetical protein